MNRKERRAEAKRQHQQNISSNINQEESMNENTQVAIAQNTHANHEETMEIITSELQPKKEQVGFFTRIKNAFIAGYRAGKAGVKEQVQEIKDTYNAAAEESSNMVIAHTKATIKTTFHILKKTVKALFSLIALPFIKLDSLIDRKEEALS